MDKVVGHKIGTPTYPLDYDANITVELQRIKNCYFRPSTKKDSRTDFHFIIGLLLCAQFLIYRCKALNSKTYMFQLFNEISVVKILEYVIAMHRNYLKLTVKIGFILTNFSIVDGAE